MRRRPPRSTRTDTLFPYTTLFRSPLCRLYSRGHAGQTCSLDAPRYCRRSTGLRRTQYQIARKSTLRSEEHASELQSLMRISYAVFCLKKKKTAKTAQYTVTGNTLTNYRDSTHYTHKQRKTETKKI